ARAPARERGAQARERGEVLKHTSEGSSARASEALKRASGAKQELKRGSKAQARGLNHILQFRGMNEGMHVIDTRKGRSWKNCPSRYPTSSLRISSHPSHLDI